LIAALYPNSADDQLKLNASSSEFAIVNTIEFVEEESCDAVSGFTTILSPSFSQEKIPREAIRTRYICILNNFIVLRFEVRGFEARGLFLRTCQFKV
jgi:hypothetical protein